MMDKRVLSGRLRDLVAYHQAIAEAYDRDVVRLRKQIAVIEADPELQWHLEQRFDYPWPKTLAHNLKSIDFQTRRAAVERVHIATCKAALAIVGRPKA